MASFAELSWEPGRFGGGSREGSDLRILKVKRLVMDHWRMDCEGRKNCGELGRAVVKALFSHSAVSP